MLTDAQIQRARADGEFKMEPFDDASLQPASYDMRVGARAFASSSKETVDVSAKGVLVVEPGDFAVLETLESVEFGLRVVAQLGLRSEYARKGLLMLSGPQVDPGFHGVLIVRVVNLAPNRIALPYQAPFLTAQFFKLTEPVENAYCGMRHRQKGITPTDVQELTETEGLTLGEMVKTLGGLAHDVSELKGSVSKLTWMLPAIVAFGIAVITFVALIK